MEAEVLTRITELGHDPDEVRIVSFFGCMYVNEKPCLVLECLKGNLKDYISEAPVSVSIVRCFGLQLLKAVSCLKAIGFVHGDIKPANILISGWYGNAVGIKLADFGGCIKIDANNPPIKPACVCTLMYRSPEIVIGLPVSFPSDMWAVALVLVEAFTGEILFPACTKMDLMHFIVTVIGTDECFLKGVSFFKYFTDNRLIMKDHYIPEIETWNNIQEVSQMVDEDNHSEKTDAEELVSFLVKALHPNPDKRISCEEAFSHTFFTMAHLREGHEIYLEEAQSRILANPGSDAGESGQCPPA